MSKRCILLAGAPDVDTLDWDEPSLTSTFESPVVRFLNNTSKRHIRLSQQPTLTGPTAKWRTLQIGDIDEPDSMPVEHDDEQTQFLSFEFEADLTDRHGHLQFLEHSIAVLDDLNSSLITPQADDLENDEQSTFLSMASATTTSFQTPISSDPLDFKLPTQHRTAGWVDLKAISSITDVRRIPNADHIIRIQPQTITVNLIVGVIATSPSRTVRLKRRDAQMDIIELTVGDETRAGFSISFWLVPIESQHPKPRDDLRGNLHDLRAGDVVLLQNVALSCFRGCVYGQSLSKRFARNSTSITVLDGESVSSSPAPVASKLLRVRKWSSDFVGVAKKPLFSFQAKHKVDDLPPDTQD